MRFHPTALLAVIALSTMLPAQAAMKLGDFTHSGSLLVGKSYESEVIYRSDFSTDDLKRMAEQLEKQQRTLEDQARQIDTLQRQLEEQRRTLDDLKRSR